ncbi:MAG: hypothetical protein ACREQY_12530 [Candidatus Binatia bacterium]
MSLRSWSLAVLAFGLLEGSAVAAPAAVRFENGKLWVTSRAVAAPDVFSAIAEKTGVRFVIDKELRPAPLTVQIEGMELERAIRNIVGAIPEVAGHTMSYTKEASGDARLSEVSIFGPGKALSAGTNIYEASGAGPPSFPTPDLRERMDRMIEAGVPRETAEKVLELTAEVQRLQESPEPGSYRPEDLSAASREQLEPLIDRGVPMERAVQMLLLQEKYQDTLKELSNMPGGLKIPELPGSPAGAPPSPSAAGEPDQGE